MKAFNQFLVDLNDGTTHSGLTNDLMELLQAVQNTGRSGSLTLKIKIASASKGGSSVDKMSGTYTPHANAYYRNDGNPHVRSAGVPC